MIISKFLPLFLTLTPLLTSAISHSCPCEYSILGDGICNMECNSKACGWDAFDCAVISDSGCLFAPVNEVGKYLDR